MCGTALEPSVDLGFDGGFGHAGVQQRSTGLQKLEQEETGLLVG